LCGLLVETRLERLSDLNLGAVGQSVLPFDNDALSRG
jgi:hypothetical protein